MDNPEPTTKGSESGMKIPVLKTEPDGSTTLVNLDLEDVVYIRVENRNLVYHTLDASYVHLSTLSDLEEHLSPYGFALTDKTNLVNFHKIKKLDAKQGKLYFEENPTPKSKYATIAFIKQKIYKNQIQRWIARNTDTSLEFSMKDNAKDPKKSSILNEQQYRA